jgi:hypothetical protein
MRRIFSPTGEDVTSTVQGYLTSGQTFVFADLYRFQTVDFIDENTEGAVVDWTYTDGAFPIELDYYQIGWTAGSYVPTLYAVGGATFEPENISHGNFTYSVGFTTNPVDVTWFIDETKSYGPWVDGEIVPISNCSWPENLTLKQAMLLGVFDMVPFWIHRAIYYPDFPKFGGSLVGTTLMHRGYLRTVAGDSEKVKITIDSLMQVFQDTQVPVQTIMPNSRSALFVPTPDAPAGDTFTDPTPIDALNLQVNTPDPVDANLLQDCWASFSPSGGALQGWKSGSPLPPLFRIKGNTAASGGTLQINFYEPYVLGSVPVINIYGQNQFSNTSGAPGFPYVPAAETTLGGVLNQTGQGGL